MNQAGFLMTKETGLRVCHHVGDSSGYEDPHRAGSGGTRVRRYGQRARSLQRRNALLAEEAHQQYGQLEQDRERDADYDWTVRIGAGGDEAGKHPETEEDV